MSRNDQRLARLLSKPRDYTYREGDALLVALGFLEMPTGKTGGSRVRFFRERDGAMVTMHKPHPNKVLKPYQVTELIDVLRKYGDIDG